MSHSIYNSVNHLFPYKDHQSVLHSESVVYQLKCSDSLNISVKPNEI